MKNILKQARSLQTSAVKCTRLWNSAFLQPDEVATEIFSRANEYKLQLTKESKLLWRRKTYTREEEAERIIGLLLSSVMINIPELQKLINMAYKLLESLSESPLKARLLVALYSFTDDEEDKEEALQIMNKWGEWNEDQLEARKLLEEITEWKTNS